MIEEGRGKKAVIGMSGGIDSTVAAYLLKKQGYQCIGISIDFFSKGLSSIAQKAYPNFFIPQLTLVQSICQKLDIPFYAINAHNQFEDSILDLIVSNKLEGRDYPVDVELSNAMIETFNEKRIQLEADVMAFGHYARLHRDKLHNTVSLNRTNFNTSDQCYLLSRVKAELLEYLVLPLSELRKDDVERLGASLGVKTRPQTKYPEVLEKHQAEAKLVDVVVAKSLRPDGILMHGRTDRHLGDHKGVHNFYLGQNNIQSSYQLHAIDKDFEVVAIDPVTANVFLDEPQEFLDEACMIHLIRLNPSVEKTKCTVAFAQIGHAPELHLITIQFKNNGFANIWFDEPLKNLRKGNLISLFASSKGGSKLLGSGYIYYLGDFTRINRGEMAQEEDLKRKRDEDKKGTLNKDFMF